MLFNTLLVAAAALTVVSAKSYPQCGGRTPRPNMCKDAVNVQCLPDPRQPINSNGVSKTSICISKEQPRCRGFMGQSCPSGMACYDHPTDPCKANQGCADSQGICL